MNNVYVIKRILRIKGHWLAKRSRLSGLGVTLAPSVFNFRSSIRTQQNSLPNLFVYVRLIAPSLTTRTVWTMCSGRASDNPRLISILSTLWEYRLLLILSNNLKVNSEIKRCMCYNYKCEWIWNTFWKEFAKISLHVCRVYLKEYYWIKKDCKEYN